MTQGGDGVTAAIFKNNTQIWPATGGPEVIANNDAYRVTTFASVPVTNGDKIRFVVQARSNPTYDSVTWPVELTVH